MPISRNAKAFKREREIMLKQKKDEFAVVVVVFSNLLLLLFFPLYNSMINHDKHRITVI